MRYPIVGDDDPKHRFKEAPPSPPKVAGDSNQRLCDASSSIKLRDTPYIVLGPLVGTPIHLVTTSADISLELTVSQRRSTNILKAKSHQRRV
jgi:hypothetical protein